MKYGVCGNCLYNNKTNIEMLETIGEIGFDYMELPMSAMMAMSDQEVKEVHRRQVASGVPCTVINNYMPGSVRVTGPDIDFKKVEDYYKKSLDITAMFGAVKIGFGCTGARNVAPGYDFDRAYKELADSLDLAGRLAKPYGVTFMIEPVRMQDANIIRTFEEGVDLAKYIDNLNVKTLADYYHMSSNEENFDAVRKYGKEWMIHFHLSYPNFPKGKDGVRSVRNLHGEGEGSLMADGGKPYYRTLPSLEDDWDYSEMVSALADIGYDGTISCEAGLIGRPFAEAARKALEFCKKTWG